MVNDLSAKFSRPNIRLVGKNHQQHHEVRSQFCSHEKVYKQPCAAKGLVCFSVFSLYISSLLYIDLKHHKRQHCVIKCYLG